MAQFTLDGVTYSRFRDIPGAVYTRSGVEYQQNAEGVWTPFDENVPPISAGVGVDVWEARTNLVVRSQELNLWTMLNASVVANATTAPDGTLTADKIVEDATATVQHGIHKAFTTTPGQTYTTSFFAKAAERSWLLMTEGNNVTAQASFNLANGTLGTVAGTGSPSATITPLGNGWYRCSLTFTPISTTANIQARPQTANGGANYTGDGASGIYAWGGQAELGASASPYIPTTNAAATRGNPSMYINAPGLLVPPFAVVAWFKTANAVAASEFRMGFSINDGTIANACEIFLSPSPGHLVRAYVQNSGTPQTDFGWRSFSPGALVKVAARFKTNSIGMSVNGQAVESNNSATLAAQYSRIQFGDNAENLPTRKLNGAIQRFQIINRDISDTELVNLTV